MTGVAKSNPNLFMRKMSGTLLGSVSDRAFVDSLFAGVKHGSVGVVIHCAALHKPHVSTHAREECTHA